MSGKTGFRKESNKEVSESCGEISVSCEEALIDTHEKEKQEIRQVGNKRAMEITSHVSVLHKGADAFEKMTVESRKRTKIAEEALGIDK